MHGYEWAIIFNVRSIGEMHLKHGSRQITDLGGENGLLLQKKTKLQKTTNQKSSCNYLSNKQEQKQKQQEQQHLLQNT